MKFYTRKRRTPVVIIVALIDIFVILLIFVIATSTFKREQPAVTLRLPESSQAAPAPQPGEAALLTVSDNGSIFLEARPVPVAELVGALRPLVAANRSIALQADTQAPFGVVIRVMDSLKEAGVQGSLPAFTEIRKIH